MGMVCCSAMLLATTAVHAADEAPDVFVQRISNETLETIRADKSLRSGDVAKIMQWVDAKLMQHVDFRRMTASAVGPAWRSATPEQQQRLQQEFKTLLIRTYSGAISQVTDQNIVLKPLRAAPDDKEVLVRTEIRGKGEPIQMDYRLVRTPGEGSGWKIFNLNVLGIWLVDNYRTQFAKEINANGVDGLIKSLSDRNKSNAGRGN
jgi:phospholipid transport system substrate-binding protein